MEVCCEVVQTPWPYGAAHLATGPDDVDVTPHRLHPAFHGSLDWHSSVHMQDSLIRLLDGADDVPQPLAERAEAVLNERLTPAAIQVEADYLRERPGYERPYGWAWALQLAATARQSSLPQAAAWAEALEPLVDVIAANTVRWLPRQAYPVRHGVHSNTAFALGLIRDAAPVLGRGDLVEAVDARTRDWFVPDTDMATSIEPSGSDFLSPALSQATLVLRVLPEGERADWLAAFLPGLGTGAHSHLFDAPQILDPDDGQLVHLAGLALTRSWHLRELAPWLAPEAAATCRYAADDLFNAPQTFITEGHFMATHWLVTMALRAQAQGQ